MKLQRLRFADYTFREMRSGTSPIAVRVVLFDVGGVLVEPSGVARMLSWMGNTVSAEELWRMWLTSPCVRAFETGRLSPEEFAQQLIADFRLPIGTDQFLEEMTRWSVTLFPGALELIEQIPSRYLRATLCNTNVIHWTYLMRNTGLSGAFPHHFASHLIGKIKPDADAFQHVTKTLGCEPQEVLFLDDNEMNVIGAQSVGMQSVRVRGIPEAESALVDFGVLTST